MTVPPNQLGKIVIAERYGKTRGYTSGSRKSDRRGAATTLIEALARRAKLLLLLLSMKCCSTYELRYRADSS